MLELADFVRGDPDFFMGDFPPPAAARFFFFPFLSLGLRILWLLALLPNSLDCEVGVSVTSFFFLRDCRFSSLFNFSFALRCSFIFCFCFFFHSFFCGCVSELWESGGGEVQCMP